MRLMTIGAAILLSACAQLRGDRDVIERVDDTQDELAEVGPIPTIEITPNGCGFGNHSEYIQNKRNRPVRVVVCRYTRSKDGSRREFLEYELPKFSYANPPLTRIGCTKGTDVKGNEWIRGSQMHWAADAKHPFPRDLTNPQNAILRLPYDGNLEVIWNRHAAKSVSGEAASESGQPHPFFIVPLSFYIVEYGSDISRVSYVPASYNAKDCS